MLRSPGLSRWRKRLWGMFRGLVHCTYQQHAGVSPQSPETLVPVHVAVCAQALTGVTLIPTRRISSGPETKVLFVLRPATRTLPVGPLLHRS